LLHPTEPTRSENRASRATNSKVTELATKSKERNERRIITSDRKVTAFEVLFHRTVVLLL